jgi:hypothetical protein
MALDRILNMPQGSRNVTVVDHTPYGNFLTSNKANSKVYSGLLSTLKNLQSLLKYKLLDLDRAQLKNTLEILERQRTQPRMHAELELSLTN